MKKRKITAVVLAGVMVVLCGCVGNEETGEVSSVPEDSAAESVTADSEVVTSEESTSEEVMENDITHEIETETASEKNEQESTSESKSYSTVDRDKYPESGSEVGHDYVYYLNEKDYPYDSEEIEIFIGGWGGYEAGYNAVSTYGYVDLSEIEKYTKLKKLSIVYSTTISAPIFLVNYDGLGKMDNVEHLRLISVYFDENANLKPLKNFIGIKTLELRSYAADWNFLKELTFIENLSLSRCDVKDADFINYMTSLKSLSLHNTNVSDYNALKENNSVEWLESIENHLYITEFEDIENLKKLKNLKHLYVAEFYNNGYTKEDFQKITDEFQEALPECELTIY